MDLVPQRVKPPSGTGLGPPVERMLQGSDRIQLQGSRRGGSSRNGTQLPAAPIRRPPGRGGPPPQSPLSPSQRSMPHTPGSPSRLQFQDLRRFQVFRPDFGGSALPAAPRGGPLTTPQASRDATDRCFAPPCRAFDTGLRRRAFPHGAASLLPGPLSATRTGLPPAGDNELTTQDQLHRRPPSPPGARKIEANEISS